MAFACDEAVPRPPDLDWLTARLSEAIAQLGRPVARIGVLVVDDARMAALHRDHCGVDATTDVLTFPDSDGDAPIEADIAVCLDEAARRAAELGHGVEREILLYALHGVLHCAGFDDHDDADFDAMHAEEDRILRAIGVGPTFFGESSGHDEIRRDASRAPGASV